MSNAEFPDKPPFDIVQFETEAKGRAAEFVAQVARLSRFAWEFEYDENEWVTPTGAQYDLPDGSQFALKHEVWHQDPTKVIAKVRATRPPVESTGIDGQRRRVVLTRSIMYASFVDDLDSYASDLQEELPEAPHLDAAWKRLGEQVGMRIMEDMLQPDYRPAELIIAETSTLVECKLPNSPNFRTEHYSKDMPANTRLAHIAARRRAGEQVIEGLYTIAEHKALIANLVAIDPDILAPEPLDFDFDEIWRNPTVPARSWIPRD